jgi:hypothetical protein
MLLAPAMSAPSALSAGSTTLGFVPGVARNPADRTGPSGPVRLCAYGDESIRRTADGVIFVLAAAVVREDRRDEVRVGLRDLLLKGQDRLHWRDEDQPRRVRIATAVADLPVQSLVVVGARVVATRQERARRQVLSRLLWELDRRQAEHLLLESRRDERDRHDVKAVGGFRNQQVLSRRLRVDHGQPLQEPMLWLPDAVAGAVGDDRCGRTECLALLSGAVEVVDMELT